MVIEPGSGLARSKGRHFADLMDDLIRRPIEQLSPIEAVRKRPGMYVGSTRFFGFIHYLVCPIALLLGRGATRVAIAADDGGFLVESDVAVSIEETSGGRFAPFEEISSVGQGHGFEGTVLNALSESLTVEVRQEHRTETLRLWCFINNGRAVEGGTHEKGLHDALDRLHRRLKLPKSPKAHRNGVVGIMSLQYPDTVWEGCIKARIGNPELRGMVCNLVIEGAEEWLQGRPEVAAQLRHLETFQFPDAWST